MHRWVALPRKQQMLLADASTTTRTRAIQRRVWRRTAFVPLWKTQAGSHVRIPPCLYAACGTHRGCGLLCHASESYVRPAARQIVLTFDDGVNQDTLDASAEVGWCVEPPAPTPPPR